MVTVNGLTPRASRLSDKIHVRQSSLRSRLTQQIMSTSADSSWLGAKPAASEVVDFSFVYG